MTPALDLRVFENDAFALDQSDACAVPGYLILRLMSAATSLAELDSGTAERVGGMLARIARAIETETGADRVYCLSFCEQDRRLHFHLFPRTAWLLDAYWQATGTRREPINGPALFEWARARYTGAESLPAGVVAVDAIARIRHHLASA